MANLKSFLYVVCSFVVAIFLIAYGPKWAERFGRSYDPVSAPLPAIGQYSELDGNASRRGYSDVKFLELAAPFPLQNLDTVQVQARSKLQITLNGFKLLVQGPAQLVFELWTSTNAKGPAVIHLSSGQLSVITEGEAGKLYVVRDGELTDPSGASVIRERSLLVTPLNIGEPPSAPIIPTPTLSSGWDARNQTRNKIVQEKISPTEEGQTEEDNTTAVTNEYLDAEIAKQQEQFQRCQNNALREQGEVKGQILVGMTISPEGKIDNARILTSTIQDDKLHTCVLQIFQRLKFKAFNGAPIVRSYPLNFE